MCGHNARLPATVQNFSSNSSPHKLAWSCSSDPGGLMVTLSSFARVTQAECVSLSKILFHPNVGLRSACNGLAGRKRGWLTVHYLPAPLLQRRFRTPCLYDNVMLSSTSQHLSLSALLTTLPLSPLLSDSF